MNNLRRTHYLISGAAIVLMFVFLMLFVRSRNSVMLIFGVILMNIAYQSVLRLFIAILCEGAFENGINSSGEWFGTNDTEVRFYEFLGLKYLKPKLPKFERTDFSLKRQSMQDIIDAGCEIEVEHEFCLIADVLSLLLSAAFGYFWIFLLFTVAGVVFDFLFVAVQRYNRPRLMTVSLKRRARFFMKLEKEQPVDPEEVFNMPVERPEQPEEQPDAEENADSEAPVEQDNDAARETETADGDKEGTE